MVPVNLSAKPQASDWWSSSGSWTRTVSGGAGKWAGHHSDTRPSLLSSTSGMIAEMCEERMNALSRMTAEHATLSFPSFVAWNCPAQSDPRSGYSPVASSAPLVDESTNTAR